MLNVKHSCDNKCACESIWYRLNHQKAGLKLLILYMERMVILAIGKKKKWINKNK